jgi:hypothetical protein
VLYFNADKLLNVLMLFSLASEKNSFRNIKLIIVGFEVLTAVVMKSTIFWDIKPCSPLSVNRRFLLNLFLDPEDGGDVFLRNVG